ncbi:hypothetical protein [Rubrimonas cliftonensis]|nr:hypothetical protein [Rubrimonas cliftonensis]
MALVAAEVLLESDAAYIAMNPYHGPRGGGRRLASLNALFIDLDVYRIPALAGLSRPAIAAQLTAHIAALDLPPASFTVDSGRGFYAVWLLEGGHPAAEPRWRAAARALVELFAALGADPACVDAARVLRLPESWHDGAGRAVTVVAGDGARHGFDALCDSIFKAAGRPTRQALAARRGGVTRAPNRAPPPVIARGSGMPRRAFWAAVQRDLGRLLAFWGGAIPIGRRDLWLHFHACSLSWTDPGADIAEAVSALAADAAPGLAPREVRTCVGTVARRAGDAFAGRRGAGGGDPRYGYAGVTIAERLGIDAGLAARIGLEQIVPVDVRAARLRRARTARRRAAGALPRAVWLALNPISRERPWEGEGVSRATWYRRLKARRGCRVRACLAGLHASAVRVAARRETGAAWLYGGEASAGGAADEPMATAIPAPRATRAAVRHLPAKRPPRAIDRPVSVMAPAAQAAARRADPPPTVQPVAPVQPAPQPLHPQPFHPQPLDAAATETIAMPAPLDPAILAAAAARLGPTDVGWLVRVVAGPDGLAMLAGLDAGARVRLAPWLHCGADGVVGLQSPDPDPAPLRRPAMGGHGDHLFDFVRPASAAPAPPGLAGAAAGRQPPTLKQTAIAQGLRLFMGAGKSEDAARRILGALFRDLRDGVVFEALAAAVQRAGDIAEPLGWIKAYAEKNYGAAARRPHHRPAAAARVGAAPVSPQPSRPIATPELLGISPERARKIRERNTLLRRAF